MRHGTLPMVINMTRDCLPKGRTFGHRGLVMRRRIRADRSDRKSAPTLTNAGCFLTLNAYAVSVSTLSTRAARIMRGDLDTIRGNSRHKKTWWMLDSGSRRCAIMSSSPPARNILSEVGDSQATAPIGRIASTSVIPVWESIPKQGILVLNL